MKIHARGIIAMPERSEIATDKIKLSVTNRETFSSPSLDTCERVVTSTACIAKNKTFTGSIEILNAMKKVSSSLETPKTFAVIML